MKPASAPGIRARAHRWRRACWLLAGLLAVCPAAAATVSEAPHALRDELRHAVRTLSREIHVYHYTARTRVGLPASGYVAPDDAALVPFLRQKIERFWDPEAPIRRLEGRRGIHLASGLYAGPDPVRSRGFGGAGDSWVGVRIALQPGFRHVDVRGWSWSPAARQQALDAGCEAETPHYLLLTAESAGCRALALELLRELGVDGIVYGFARVAFPVCDEPADASFVLLDPLRISQGTAALFTAVAGSDALAAERSRIQEMFDRARAAGESRRPAPWPDLAARPAEAEMTAWMRRHLFGCGPSAEDLFAEDRPTPSVRLAGGG